MIWPFKCRHPFDRLVVGKPPIETARDEDFTKHRIDMHCTACGESLPIRWAQFVGGVDGFLARGRTQVIAAALGQS